MWVKKILNSPIFLSFYFFSAGKSAYVLSVRNGEANRKQCRDNGGLTFAAYNHHRVIVIRAKTHTHQTKLKMTSKTRPFLATCTITAYTQDHLQALCLLDIVVQSQDMFSVRFQKSKSSQCWFYFWVRECRHIKKRSHKKSHNWERIAHHER
jgi:hypothetical protein